MNRTKSKEIYGIQRFVHPSLEPIAVGSTFQRSRSFMERDFLAASSSNDGVLEARSRFEEVFLSSPRAQEIYSSAGPVRQKAATAKSFNSFNDVVKMAESFHNKSSTSTSLHSTLSDQSLANVKPKTAVCSLNNKEFEISPFKPLVNDSTIKKKVRMVISRLEDDDDITPTATTTKVMKSTHHVERGLSKDSGFNDAQSDSAGSSEPTFTTIRNRDTTVPPGIVERQSAKSNGVATIAEAQTANSGEEVHISFDESDGEIDVVTEDVQVGNDENNKKTGGEDSKDCVDGNNNLNAKAKEETIAKSLNSSTELSTEQHKLPRLNVLKLWSIKAVKTRTHMGIIVEGQRSEDPEGELWHSTAIVSRVNAKLLQTKSGSQYRLVGPINETVTLQQGFSSEFVKSFKYGFPSNWLSLVSDHFNSQSSSESEDEKSIPDQLVKKATRPTSKMIKHSKTTATPPESKVKIKGKETALKTPVNRKLPKEVELKTTRSGRMVKPPLAWWRGQRILTDRHHNLEGIDPGGEEHTPISPMYSVDFKLPLKSEKSSPVKQSHFLSDDENRKVRKTHTKKSSTEESDIPPQPQQKINSPKHPTGGENSGKDRKTLRSPYKAIGTDKSHKSADRNKKDSRKTGAERVRDTSKNGKLTDGVGEQNASYVFEESSSISDVSSEGDVVQNLKKKLFYSPKKSPGKSQNLEVRSEAEEMNDEDKRSDQSRVLGGTQKKKTESVGRGSPRKTAETAVNKSHLPNNASISKKNTSASSVLEEDDQNNQKRKYPATVRVNFEERNVEQSTDPQIPSPPKRVLRSHGKKSNNFKYVEMSDADSEDGTMTRGKMKRATANLKTSESESRVSSCEEQSDNSRRSGKGSKVPNKKRNAQKRPVHGRVQALVTEATTQSSEEDSDEMPRKPPRKSQTHSKLAKTNAVTQKNSGKKGSGKTQASKVSKNVKDGEKQQNVLSDETPWEDEEIERLNEALYTISGNTPMFWQKISRKVGSRTAQECQLKHQGHVLVSNKKETSAKKTSAKEKNAPAFKGPPQQNVKTVSGGVGTIKRKREIRELLEQQDMNYEDDIFDATPFKKKKDIKLPFNLNSNSSDEAGDDGDEEEEESESERGISYKTPSSRTPSSRFRPLGPLSTTTTPSSEFISPSLLQQVNRKDMDHYIYRMQQGKRGTQAHTKPKAKMRTSTPKKPASSSSHLPVVNSELFEAHPTSDHDSAEEDNDYYFSDE